MKLFLSLLLLMAAVWSADVDTKLYTDNNASYYQAIEKQIIRADKSGLRPKSVTAEEKLQLARVRAAASQVVQIEKYDLQALAKGDITPEHLYALVNAVAHLRLKGQLNAQVLQEIQSKLTFIKQNIERITEDEKPRLLTYQLQFAYYKLQQKNIETKNALLNAHETEVRQLLTTDLPALNCNSAASMDKELAQTEKRLEQLEHERIALQLERENAIIEESDRLTQIHQKIEVSDRQRQNTTAQKLSLQIQQSLCLLHQKHNKDFFVLLDKIETLASDRLKEKRPLYLMQIAVLKEIAKQELGTTKLLFGASLQETKKLLATVGSYLTSPLFIFNEQPISVVSLFKALFLVILGFILGMFYKRWIARMARRWPDMSQMSVRLASNIGYYLIMVIAVMNAIGSIGIDMTSISLIAGALSIGIGFGLQTVVSNFIAGVILMFERTIRIGDTIEISDVLRGRVTDMRIRSTTVKTFDNIDVVVPNSSFIQNNVINWTLEDKTRRLHIPFGVAYGTDVEDVRNAVLNELDDSTLSYIKDDKEKQPEIWMVSMSSSSVDFELLVWVDWSSKLRPNSLRSDFMILIYNALYKHDIKIPFPQLDLYVKQLPEDTTP